MKRVGWLYLLWLALMLFQQLGYFHDRERGAVLALTLVGGLAVWRFGSRLRGDAPPAVWAVLPALLGCWWHLDCFWRHVVSDGQIDSAFTTVAGLKALFAGRNPYAEALDRDALALDPRFAGCKYGPVMLWAYAPLSLTWGLAGLVTTNLLLMGVLTWQIFDLVRRSYPSSGNAACWAAAVFLYLPGLPEQLYRFGVNDLPPVVLLMAACQARQRSREGWSGFWLGLSVSAKLAPGLILLPLMVSASRRPLRTLGGLLAGVAPWLLGAALFGSPFIDNLVLWPQKDSDVSSWTHRLSLPDQRGVHRLANLGLLLWAGLARRCSFTSLLAAAAGSLLLFYVGSAMAHDNYFLWFFPFAVAWIGALHAPQCDDSISSSNL